MNQIPTFFLRIFICYTVVGCSTTTIEKVVITDPVTFEGDVRIIISDHCLPCHGGVFASAGLNLEGYENVREATEHGTLLESINSNVNPMPQSGLMSRDLIATIEQWSLEGYIEN